MGGDRTNEEFMNDPSPANPPVISELVERVAACLYGHLDYNFRWGSRTSWPQADDHTKKKYREAARAALSASGLLEREERMREALADTHILTLNARSIAKYERNRKNQPELAAIIERLCGKLDEARTTLSADMGDDGGLARKRRLGDIGRQLPPRAAR